MQLVIVQREFDAPREVAELQAIEDENAWCLETNNVTFSHTYVSADGKTMLCVYQAPDAEAVRRVQDQAKMPYSRIYAVERVQPDPT